MGLIALVVVVTIALALLLYAYKSCKRKAADAEKAQKAKAKGKGTGVASVYPGEDIEQGSPTKHGAQNQWIDPVDSASVLGPPSWMSAEESQEMEGAWGDDFADLPEAMRPPISEPKKHEGFFDFEKEKLDMNDLRILIANDLFRLNTDKKEPAADQ